MTTTSDFSSLSRRRRSGESAGERGYQFEQRPSSFLPSPPSAGREGEDDAPLVLVPSCARSVAIIHSLIACSVLLTTTVFAADSSTNGLSPQEEWETFHFADPHLAIELVAAEPD